MTTLHPSLADKVQSIIAHVGDSLAVHVEEITGARRTARTAHARQMAMTLIRQNTDLSLEEIGGLFHRDHGTVMHAIKATKARITTCATTAAIHAAITERLQP